MLLIHFCGSWFAFCCDVQDEVAQLMTTISSQMVKFDLALNTSLTTLFFELLSSYVSCMIVFCEFEDRRLIVGLFGGTHEIVKGTSHQGYHRLSQLVAEYIIPYKMFPTEFSAHHNTLSQALMNLKLFYDRRCVEAVTMRNDNILNIVHAPAQLSAPVNHTEAYSNIVSLSQLKRWICFGYLLVPNAIANPEALDNLTNALGDGFMIQLYRDLGVNIHQAYETMFANYKDSKQLSKQKSKVAEQIMVASAKAPMHHHEKRTYLRQTLSHLIHVFTDQPGLLAPKAPLALAALSLARDEIFWLYLHRNADDKQKPKSRAKFNYDLLKDERVPELLFLTTKLDGLFMQHSKLLQKYYTEYLTGLDAAQLKSAIEPFVFGQREQHLIASMFKSIEECTQEGKNMQGFRLDHLRLQVEMSVQQASQPLDESPQIAEILSLIEMHSYLRDDSSAYAQQTAGLGQLLYFSKLFIEDFNKAMTLASQYRYIMAFGLICRSYPNFSNTFIPACREIMTKQAIIQLDKICQHVANKAMFLLEQIVRRESNLSEQLLPYPAVDKLVSDTRAKSPQKGSPKKTAAPPALPGDESRTYSSELVDSLRGFQQALTDLCWAMNHEGHVKINNYTFSPKEYFTENVVEFLRGEIQRRLRTEPGQQLPRPSVLWHEIKSLMGSIRHVESYININMAEVLENVLIDQTIADDVSQNATVAATYIQFYLKLVFDLTPKGGICVSTSRKAFVSLSGGGQIQAEEYTDASELQAVCVLLGAFGVKQLDSMLLKQIYQYVDQMKNIIGANRADLEILKSKTAKTQQCSDSLMRLKHTKEFTQLGIQIGTALEFRKMLTEALGVVSKSRIPFIHGFIKDLHAFHSKSGQYAELALSTGLMSAVDPSVMREMQRHCRNSEADYSLWSHMMVMYAAALWTMASDENTVFRCVALHSGECIAHTTNVGALWYLACTSMLGKKQRTFC